MISYLAGVMPFEKKYQNYLEIFNELCILGATYHLITFTNYVDNSDLQYNSGWSIIAITTLDILVNMIVIMTLSIKDLIATVKALKAKIKAWCQKRKAKKE